MASVTEALSVALADRYMIQQEIGAGGMATVYLAHDLKHDRKVALKVLRPELAAVIGAERFLNEIKVTANLQHPHILPLHDSGEAGSYLYYVMPFVEGDTLRDKLGREKQLAISEAVEIARGVAGALDYAHRQGVIHRDIKPENVLIHDGQPLVADFGIALAVSAAGGSRLTETGLSVGTPHYMSPEQAMGDRELDARSDIYSLGAVLYEMLTGDPPYTGSTAQAIVAKVITEKAPPVTATRDTVPPHVDAAIQKSLAKLPADRFHSASEFAEALSRPGFVPTPMAAPGAAAAAPKAGRTFTTPQVAGIAAVAVLAIAAAAWGWLRPAPAPPLSRFAITLPQEQGLVANHDGNTLAFSPDGRRFVYTGPDRALYVRELGQLEARPLPGTEGARGPFFSPDGEWVAFYADAALHKVALSGGPPLTIAEVGAAGYRGGTWTEGDVIVFTPNTGGPLLTVSAAGGEAVPLTALDSASAVNSHRWPSALPGGKAVVFTLYTGGANDEASLGVASLESGEVKPLQLSGLHAEYAATGHLVYGTADGSLVAVPFALDELEVTGPPVSLLQGVMTRNSVLSEFSLSRSGALAYLGGVPPELALVAVERNGGSEETLVPELMTAESPRVAPDGRRVALSREEAGNTDIWLYAIRERTMTRMTFEGNNRYPEWTPDGRRIVFSTGARDGLSGGRDLFWVLADGSGSAERLFGTAAEEWEISWMPDGESSIMRQSDTGDRNIYSLTPGTDSEPQPLIVSTFNERTPMVSPDGNWLAYASDESGRDEIYVRPLPGPGGKRQVSIDGGTEPRWSLDGSELIYRGRDRSFYAVPIQTSPTMSVGQRTALFEDTYVVNPNHTNYDINPADGRFILLKGSERPIELIVVLNWYEELKERMDR